MYLKMKGSREETFVNFIAVRQLFVYFLFICGYKQFLYIEKIIIEDIELFTFDLMTYGYYLNTTSNVNHFGQQMEDILIWKLDWDYFDGPIEAITE